MTQELLLKRKWTFRAGDKQIVFVKRSLEQTSHVLMKAFLWALYLPEYPDLSVEIHIGDRYKPDVVQLDETGQPLFWGESGKVSPKKIQSLLRRYPRTHFAIAKWGMSLGPLVEVVTEAMAGFKRIAPFDLISFPSDSPERFINEGGDIEIDRASLDFIRLPATKRS
jgi:hypothetical protein